MYIQIPGYYMYPTHKELVILIFARLKLYTAIKITSEWSNLTSTCHLWTAFQWKVTIKLRFQWSCHTFNKKSPETGMILNQKYGNLIFSISDGINLLTQ